MFAVTALVLVVCFTSSVSTECQGSMGTRCMTSSELPEWKSVMIGGDACFLYNSKRVKFTHNRTQPRANIQLLVKTSC